jgi:Tfp pilus assembly pilus retraction ATPase PilT
MADGLIGIIGGMGGWVPRPRKERAASMRMAEAKLAAEIMIATLGIQECIKDIKKTDQMKDLIERGRDIYGSQSFDQHLSVLYSEGHISLETAKSAATNPADFERALSIE